MNKERFDRNKRCLEKRSFKELVFIFILSDESKTVSHPLIDSFCDYAIKNKTDFFIYLYDNQNNEISISHIQTAMNKSILKPNLKYNKTVNKYKRIIETTRERIKQSSHATLSSNNSNSNSCVHSDSYSDDDINSIVKRTHTNPLKYNPIDINPNPLSYCPLNNKIIIKRLKQIVESICMNMKKK
eukprot:29146_1